MWCKLAQNQNMTTQLSHDTTFTINESDTNGSFKIWRCSSKYNVKYVFVNGKITRQRKACGNY